MFFITVAIALVWLLPWLVGAVVALFSALSSPFRRQVLHYLLGPDQPARPADLPAVAPEQDLTPAYAGTA